MSITSWRKRWPNSSVFCSLILPALMPMFDATWDTNLRLSQTSLRASFVVPAICFAVVGAYAVAFRRRGSAGRKEENS